jgi:hypothetical protein
MRIGSRAAGARYKGEDQGPRTYHKDPSCLKRLVIGLLKNNWTRYLLYDISAEYSDEADT